MMNRRFNKNLYSLEELGSNIRRITVRINSRGKEKCKRKEFFLVKNKLK